MEESETQAKEEMRDPTRRSAHISVLSFLMFMANEQALLEEPSADFLF